MPVAFHRRQYKISVLSSPTSRAPRRSHATPLRYGKRSNDRAWLSSIRELKAPEISERFNPHAAGGVSFAMASMATTRRLCDRTRHNPRRVDESSLNDKLPMEKATITGSPRIKKRGSRTSFEVSAGSNAKDDRLEDGRATNFEVVEISAGDWGSTR